MTRRKSKLSLKMITSYYFQEETLEPLVSLITQADLPTLTRTVKSIPKTIQITKIGLTDRIFSLIYRLACFLKMNLDLTATISDQQLKLWRLENSLKQLKTRANSKATSKLQTEHTNQNIHVKIASKLQNIRISLEIRLIILSNAK